MVSNSERAPGIAPGVHSRFLRFSPFNGRQNRACSDSGEAAGEGQGLQVFILAAAEFLLALR